MKRRRAAIAAALSSSGLQDFLRQTVLLLLVFGLLNVSNYAFHVVVSRLLGPSAYGALAALLAVILVLSVPFAVLDRKSTRLNSSHIQKSRMPSSA